MLSDFNFVLISKSYGQKTPFAVIGFPAICREVDALAGADALEVGLLVVGNAVVADIQLCQRPGILDAVSQGAITPATLVVS